MRWVHASRWSLAFASCTIKSVRLQSPALAASNWRLAAWIAARVLPGPKAKTADGFEQGMSELCELVIDARKEWSGKRCEPRVRPAGQNQPKPMTLRKVKSVCQSWLGARHPRGAAPGSYIRRQSRQRHLCAGSGASAGGRVHRRRDGAARDLRGVSVRHRGASRGTRRQGPRPRADAPVLAMHLEARQQEAKQSATG